jgi:hypothetical protein
MPGGSAGFSRNDHLLRVHAEYVISTEDGDDVGLIVEDQVQGLVDGVGRAGVPVRPQALLGGNGGDVVPEQARQPPGRGDVAVEAMALVLGEHADPAHTRVHQVGKREVDQPVQAPEGNSGLGPVRRERG